MAAKHCLLKPSSLGIKLRRTYWTATTFRSGSPQNLVETVQQTITSFAFSAPTGVTAGPSILLFTISKRIPSKFLASLVQSFQDLVPSIEPIGCLTEDSSIGLHSVSIARWSGAATELVPFTSSIRSRASISVGREILPSDRNDSTADYMGQAHQVGAESDNVNLLPEELRRIPQSSIDSLVFFSAPSPQPFLNTLQRTFPSANLMGLVGSSTAFETGRQSTLFRNRTILGEHGAVGIAILKPVSKSLTSPVVKYQNMETLGAPMRVTEAQGNIILTLDSKRATGYLLEVIRNSDRINESQTSSELIISKEKEFYLGFLDEQNLVVEVCRIIGGSTSRGTMALDREREIKVNQMVQFIHSSELSNGNKIIDESIPSKSPTTSTEPRKMTLEFACCDPYSNPQEQASMESKEMEKVERVDGLFCGGSEAGFVPRHQQIVNLLHSRVHYSL
ncbi:uncharacterized protein PGTG_14163 [Puccinia graminis f. sp. tritici CRL 75-36-700-3]|uniref:FIST domain-containing protein n=1 Tax=Puccinia graminis f. sp. tritici (strain CRL 75-36-700-3 / race SCCL) TaxID=418459 RepID=E3KX54_PUCGT|nr:uncharacterized protein PGTG_14163 [Puccinia graminis f. sp. tritici CRL 75-36-700-3]EFP88824.2 hypothetical protein PGTG_14163 [Puccinia graminis f. sp. tritici CRL 75-36-700-3]